MPTKPKYGVIAVSISAVILIYVWARNGDKDSLTSLFISKSSFPYNVSKAQFAERIKTEKLSIDDPEMIALIGTSLIYPQDAKLRHLPATPPDAHTSQLGEDAWVDDFLKQRTNGFFVECGALDGELYSNTVFFELKRNWTGLLIEAGPRNYQNLLQKRRHAYSLHACLSPVSWPKALNFIDMAAVGALTDFQEKAHLETMKLRHGSEMKTANSSVICYPFYSILLTIGQKHIDYFSLDIEGAELPVLRTIPFNKIYIDVIVVEFGVWGSVPDGLRKLEDLRTFFAETKLYKEVGIIHNMDVAFHHV